MRVRSTLAVSVGCGVAVLALSATVAPPVSAQGESEHRDPGIYVAASGQSPHYEMIHSHFGAQQTNTGKAMFTMGLGGMSIKVDITGAKAPQRVSTGDLVFLFQMNMPGAPAKGRNQQQAPPDINAVMAQAGRDHEMPAGLKPDMLSLIHASVEGDTRHLDLGSQGGKKVLGGSRRAKDAVDVTIEKLAADQFRVKLKSPLEPGEYAFTMTQGGAGQVWDFGVDGK